MARRRDEQIEQEVSRTLRSLDGLEPIRCRPDFSMRLQARIRREETDRVATAWRRYLLPVMLALLVILNGVTTLTALRSRSRQDPGRQRAISAFAAEYALSQPRIDSWNVRE